MELGLRGKVAIVSAASKGLGKAVALGLAAEGVSVAICSRDQASVDRAAAEIRDQTGSRVLPVAVDLTDGEAIKAFVQRAAAEFGRLDILFVNTGGPPAGTFRTLDDAAWQRGFELIQLSAVRLTREILPHLRQAGGGRIVYSTSISI